MQSAAEECRRAGDAATYRLTGERRGVRFCAQVFWFYFFFFSSRRRHTRCSRDWSSDVCSSDLPDWRMGCREPWSAALPELPPQSGGISGRQVTERAPYSRCRTCRGPASENSGARSEERRVGKECRSRWARDHEKENEEKVAK